MFRISLDAMGGDLAPEEIIKGAVEAVNDPEFASSVVLFGREEQLLRKLIANFPKERISVTDASDSFPMDEKPSLILRRKETSMYKAAEAVKDGKTDALVSAGNTGALLALATFVVGRITGVSRPAICTLLPNKKGFTVFLDSGANLEVKKEVLLSFAKLGLSYAKSTGKEKPTIGLLNIGLEEDKGTEEIKEAYRLFKDTFGTSFKGFCEAREINYGETDVIITDGWSGNIALKTMEGAAKLLLERIKEAILDGGISSKIGAALIKKQLRNVKIVMDPRTTGGANILGVKAPVVKAHGNSDALAVKNALKVAEKGLKNNLIEKIIEEFSGDDK